MPVVFRQLPWNIFPRPASDVRTPRDNATPTRPPNNTTGKPTLESQPQLVAVAVNRKQKNKKTKNTRIL
jgi:hypothetical protein